MSLIKKGKSYTSKTIPYKNVPLDVSKVWLISHLNQPISSKLYDECMATIRRYPKYFTTGDLKQANQS